MDYIEVDPRKKENTTYIKFQDSQLKDKYENDFMVSIKVKEDLHNKCIWFLTLNLRSTKAQ